MYVPSHTARDLDKDLKAAGIPKTTADGKLDFHACRLAYINFVLESGASVKEAQALARHSTPELTMNVYGRTRKERLSETAEKVAANVLPAADNAIFMPRQAVGAEQETQPSDLQKVALLKNGGGGGNRTRVRDQVYRDIYVRSRSLDSRPLRCQSTMPRSGTSSVKSRPPPPSMSLGQPAKDVVRIRRAGSTDPNGLANFT